ncbi:MAG: AAA family ATPase, partial [Candidatus Heimdallarchaeota archaeon]|nr:AAA family ATPase [Candidatus Heimdallarchaeota archaeon]
DIDMYDWEFGCDQVIKAIPEKITHVFSSEPSYEPYFSKYYIGANIILLDKHRSIVSISSTQIRRNLFAHWEFIPSYVRSSFIKTIVFIGTESCGKSTLVRNLAKIYNTNYVAEVGRDYCEKSSNQLILSDFYSIAMEHWLSVQKAKESSNKILFVDTEAVVTQYYLSIYLSEKSALIDQLIDMEKYDIYIFLEPDVKWKDDGLRFLGDQTIRIVNNQKLKTMFDDYGITYEVISGDYPSRLEQVISVLRHYKLS